MLDVGRPINITLRVEEGGHNLERDDADGVPAFRFPIVEDGDAAVATVQLDDPGTYASEVHGAGPRGRRHGRPVRWCC